MMVLPQAILFPQSLMPLYIFEQRYRKMLREVLDGSRVFGVALAKSEGRLGTLRQPHRIAGIGVVRVCVDNPDGSSHLILQGFSRVKLIEFTQVHPFLKARVEPINSTNSSGIEVESLMVKVTEVAIAKAQRIPQMPGQISRFLSELKDPDLLSDIVGYTLVDETDAKQRLLETADVRQRLHDLIPMLT